MVDRCTYHIALLFIVPYSFLFCIIFWFRCLFRLFMPNTFFFLFFSFLFLFLPPYVLNFSSCSFCYFTSTAIAAAVTVAMAALTATAGSGGAITKYGIVKVGTRFFVFVHVA